MTYQIADGDANFTSKVIQTFDLGVPYAPSCYKPAFSMLPS